MRFFLSAFLLLLSASAASATPISVDAGWYGFCFGGPGSQASAGCENDGVGTAGNSVTFTALSNVLLKVTDAFNAGDSFDVYVNAILAFQTSSVASATLGITDPDVAYASPQLSHGSILLGPGSYSVDVVVRDSPFMGGGAYLEVESAQSAVPEPSTMVLLGTALAGLALRRRP